jgi:hypothetical protein
LLAFHAAIAPEFHAPYRYHLPAESARSDESESSRSDEWLVGTEWVASILVALALPPLLLRRREFHQRRRRRRRRRRVPLRPAPIARPPNRPRRRRPADRPVGAALDGGALPHHDCYDAATQRSSPFWSYVRFSIAPSFTRA